MNKFDALRIFCSAAESGHFNETARQLGVSPQVVSRAIHQLEQDFGDTLFVRDTRQMRITPFGEQVLQSARQIIGDTDQLFRRFSQQERSIEAGLVRVELPQTDYFPLLPAMLERLRDYPDIILDWRNGNQYSNATAGQIDVGLRVGSLPGQDFIVKPVASVRPLVAASPELVSQYGEPADLDDLHRRYPLAVLMNSNNGKYFEWTFQSGSFLPHNPVFIANQIESILQAALQGRGFCQLSGHYLYQHIQSGSLQTICDHEAADTAGKCLFTARNDTATPQG